jgi:hypothetical protein
VFGVNRPLKESFYFFVESPKQLLADAKLALSTTWAPVPSDDDDIRAKLDQIKPREAAGWLLDMQRTEPEGGQV